MTEPLGLSIGTTNLVAARVGRPPVLRKSVLTVFADRAPEVGVPAPASPGRQPGLVLTGFVDRVGDPVPLLAADGSAHRGEEVLAEALAAMARTVEGGSPVAIAVPAHWGPGTVGALRGALRSQPILAPDGLPAALIPDSVAALAALQAAPGLPDHGIVVLVDFGGSGTSITLADAGANLDAVGQTVRYPEFSGEAIDQLLLDHILAGIAEADDVDPASTTAVGSLHRLREQCQTAKESLSVQTATVVSAELPGFRSDIRVTRAELDQLLAAPIAGLLAAVDDTLRRNGIAIADVSAVATVGGGAAIPAVTQRLSEHAQAPVVTTPESALNVAAGAALVANESLDAQAATGLAQAATGLAPAADVPTAMAPAAWATGAAGLAANQAADDGASSATFRALAWSQDDDAGGDPVPYTGGDYYPPADPGSTAARPPVAFASDDDQDDPALGPLAWYKRPPVLFGVAAAAALLATGGLVVTLTSSVGDPAPVTETATPPPNEPSPPALPEPITTVTVGPDGVATTTVSQPPPPPPPSTTTTAPTTTTTTQPTTTTTTTTTTPSTTTTTTQTTTPTTTTTAPSTTTTTKSTATQTTPPTTSAPPPTTSAAPPPTTVEPQSVTTTVAAPDDGA